MLIARKSDQQRLSLKRMVIEDQIFRKNSEVVYFYGMLFNSDRPNG